LRSSRRQNHLCITLYRDGSDPFDLIEIVQSLALDVSSASWPIGMGRDFLGPYDLFADALLLFERGVHDRVVEPLRCSGLDAPRLPRAMAEKPHSSDCARDIPPLLQIKTAGGHSAERTSARKYGENAKRWIYLPSRPRRLF